MKRVHSVAHQDHCQDTGEEKVRTQCTVVSWGSIIRLKIFAQNFGFIVAKLKRLMKPEGLQMLV